jgi:hypothetical protein
MNISFIKDYYNEQTDCEFCGYDELCCEINRYLLSPYPVGLLLHHRYHVTNESFELVSRILDYIDENGAVPVSMETIYKRLKNNNER